MKEEQPRLLVQHMTMNGRHLDAVGPQRIDNGVHLTAGKNKIPGDSRLATAGRLEVDRCRDTHWSDGGNLHSGLHDRIAPRHSELVDTATGFAFAADQLI